MSTPGRIQAPLRLGLTAIYAVCFVLIKAGLAYAPPLLFGGLRALIGGAALLAISALLERGSLAIWNIQFVAALLFLALAGTAFANAAWYWLLQRGEVSRSALSLFLVPVVGLGIAALVFGERVGPLEIAGSLLTIAAIGIAAWSPERRLPAARPTLP